MMKRSFPSWQLPRALIVPALLSCLAAALPVAISTAAPPVIAPGECLYLVGAPPGEPLAATEETDAGTLVRDTCTAVDEHVGTNEGLSNSAHAFALTPLGFGRRTCTAAAWISHTFSTSPDGEPVRGHVTVTGGVLGFVELPASGSDDSEAAFDVSLQILEIDPSLPTPTILASETLLSGAAGLGLTTFDEPFSRRLDATLRPGRTHAVRLVLTVWGSFAFTSDFGSPGSGRNVHYDSIETCLDPPADNSALIALLDAHDAADDAADLERKLYAKECMPSVWMPAAQGGRLEDARALVANLLSRAVATGDPNVNARVAQSRLDQADAAILAGQYQRACRNLADGLGALTTP